MISISKRVDITDKIMDERVLSVLEYKKIIELLQGEAGSDLTRKRIEEIAPYDDPVVVTEELRSTTEAVDLIVRKGAMPTGGIYDVSQYVKYAEKGGTLTPAQLLRISFNLNIADSVKRYMCDEVVKELKIIGQMAELLVSEKNLYEEIHRCIISEDEISDNASANLKDIRRKIVYQNTAIRIKLNKMVSSEANRAYLQDSIVTLRGGRYVIPVKQEHRGKFSGVIHDRSKGGATVFIEPEAILQMNNELKELIISEQAEIAKILRDLSSEVARARYNIKNNQNILVELDFIMAKGKLSVKMSAQPPVIDDHKGINIINGVHPLLNREKAVPLNVELGRDYKALIITGPNTGGKTVAIKTVGLFALMVQSGLHIPASSQSSMPVFKHIYADIGDEQSIEQSLSTFSSHMKNIVSILEEADENSLVLLDELGAGTDPTEGAALAVAVLKTLFRRKSMVMATTHYNDLKKYAISTAGVENGSMEFNVETLSPTYRLIVGVPGKSNAFEIASKLGLSKSVIREAENFISSKDMEFEQLIANLEDIKLKAEIDSKSAEDMMQNALLKMEEAKNEVKKAQAEKEKIMASARLESRKLIREAESASREIGRELKALSKEASLKERKGKFDHAKERLKELKGKYSEPLVKKVNNVPVKAENLKVGDRVKVLSLEQTGTLLTLPDAKGDLQVKLGALKTKVKISDIVLMEQSEISKNKKKTLAYAGLYSKKSISVSPSLNVQGQSLDEALISVSKYIDDVFMAGLEKVTIIHGRGEGILKKGIRDALKANKQVKSAKAGAYNEGGEGVTVVTMKI